MIAQHRSWLDQAWRTSCNCHRSGSCARDVQMPGVVRPGAAPTLVVASLMATRMRMRCAYGVATWISLSKQDNTVSSCPTAASLFEYSWAGDVI